MPVCGTSDVLKTNGVAERRALNLLELCESLVLDTDLASWHRLEVDRKDMTYFVLLQNSESTEAQARLLK